MFAGEIRRHSFLMRTSFIVVSLAASLIVSGAALAAHRHAQKPDQPFLSEAARGNMLEVELGRLAASHAEHSSVKDFGRHMVDDHTKIEGDMKGLAERKGVTLPTRLTATQKKTVDRLTKLHGSEFDRAYMSAMVEDHSKDAAKFQDEASKAADPDVKSFASSTLPTIQQHLEQAKDVQSGLSHATSGVPGTSLH